MSVIFAVARSVDEGVLHRVLRLLPLNPGHWAIRRSQGGSWYCPGGALSDQCVAEMLAQHHWLACPAPEDGVIDRIVIDIDGRGHGVPDEERDARYWAVRRALGEARIPLVYRTPGEGLHVAYRIPPTPIERLIHGQSDGLVADALRAAGVDLAPGAAEIYPQQRQVLRLPLGRSMPMLNPETLEVIPAAAIGDAYDEDMLHGAVDRMEDWHRNPIQDLIPHLEGLAAVGRDHHRRVDVDARTIHRPPVRTGAVRVSQDVVNLIQRGLVRGGSRHQVEFLLGSAAFAMPALFARWGLSATPKHSNVAMALSRWLAEMHHGLSKEWTAHRRRYDSDDGAAAAWARRYLQPDAHGERPVDRMLRAADAHGSPRVPSMAEMDRLVAASTEAWSDGRARYRQEVWGTALLRAVRQLLSWDVPHRTQRGWVEIELKAQWMETWAWGGANVGGQTGYVVWRGTLERAQLLIGRRKYYHNPVNDLPGLATTYATPIPEVHDASYLGQPITRILHRIGGRCVDGQPVSLDAAVHALYLHRRGVDLDRRYGASIAGDVRALIRALVPAEFFRR